LNKEPVWNIGVDRFVLGFPFVSVGQVCKSIYHFSFLCFVYSAFLGIVKSRWSFFRFTLYTFLFLIKLFLVFTTVSFLFGIWNRKEGRGLSIWAILLTVSDSG
jgi:hypothetical protein